MCTSEYCILLLSDLNYDHRKYQIVADCWIWTFYDIDLPGKSATGSIFSVESGFEYASTFLSCSDTYWHMALERVIMKISSFSKCDLLGK